ncbi:hypothetical protein BTVI_119276 [Pitangus sulphuratus]|nr:hypothetical protein BTVI_119276 [Pitangus sulphuratus]
MPVSSRMGFLPLTKADSIWNDSDTSVITYLRTECGCAERIPAKEEQSENSNADTKGQVTIQAKFGNIYLPEDAEFYFVYDGSLKRHTMFAEQVSDNALQSIVPECVTATSHKLLLDKFGLRVKDLQLLDNNQMMAIAYEELPSTWNTLGHCPEGEPKHKVILLQLVMKLDLFKLSLFLAAQPGGSSALALPSEEGATPLDLALQHGHSKLVEVFTKGSGLSEQETCSAGNSSEFFQPTPKAMKSEHRHSTLDVLRKLKSPPTFFTATRLSAMLSGSDEVYANCMVVDQTGDLKTNYIHGDGVSSEMCLNPTNLVPMAKSSSSPSLEENDQYMYVPNEGSQRPGVRHTISPSRLYLADSYLPFKTHGFIKDRGQLYADMKRSSSLDDLEVDGGSGGALDRSHIYYPPLSSSEAMASSRDGLDLSTGLQPKECTMFGIRSRSYSCSSPKGLVGRPRILRDFAVRDSNEERAYSLPEQSREKKYGIQEEEWNKYIVTSKNESEKCKKSQERYRNKNKPQAGVTNSLPGDIPQMVFSSVHPSSSVPIGLSYGKREASQQSYFLSKSVPSASFERRATQFSEQDSETSPWKYRSQSEEMLQALGTFSSMDAFMVEDDVDLSQWTDLCTDAEEFEAESWSLVVDPVFCSKQEKDVIKRQDVIFELMQTEVHHIHTLLIMSEIFRKGMKEELQLDHSTVNRIFPCLDELLEMHRQFFFRMKDRRQGSCEAGNERNFVISRIGDILVQQFSEENATKMEKIYGEFCSHQKEAVNLFKELQQNKKFQNFIKLRNSNLLARRRGIPECILLVTQRITKYPVLVERILQYSKEGTEEHKDLCKALCLIKDVIAAVDLKVNEYEKKQKLLEIFCKTENKTYTKLKNGHVFRKQDLMRKERILLHEGLVYWKTATGRFKGPEMYEVHMNSKEERNNWMRHIQDAVESCPEEEEEEVKMSESDEDRRIAEAKAYRIQKYQELLSNQDQQICNYLEEKLHVFAELGDIYGFDDVHVEPHLLIKPDSGETPQAAPLLAAALREVESLCEAVTTSQVSETDRSEENTEEVSVKHRFTANEILESLLDDAEIKEAAESSEIDLSVEKEMADANLENKAALAIQDSHRELHRLLLQENEKTGRGHGSRLNLLLEQEKYRNLEKQRVELANIHKLKQQFQQEQQRWLHECDQRQREQEAQEVHLGQRERECGCKEELLERSQQGLALQLQEYQQNLERLQEGQKMVERERENVKIQRKLLWHWKHGQQSNLFSSRAVNEIMGHNQLDSLHGENEFYFNEAVVCVSLRSLDRSDSSLVYEDGVYGLNISNSDVGIPVADCFREVGGGKGAHFEAEDPDQRVYGQTADLNTSQIQGPETSIPNKGSIPLPQVDSLDTESGGRVEEKIVYL